MAPSLKTSNRRHRLRRLPLRTALLTAILLVVCPMACTTSLAPRYARPALHQMLPALAMPALVDLKTAENGFQSGKLIGNGEEVLFEVQRCSIESLNDGRATASVTPQDTATTAARPMVLLVPILAGGQELMDIVAQRLRGYGFDVAFCARAGRALSPPQRGPELNELFRRTVLHQRMLLKWLRSTEAAPPALHVLGISMGGIISTVLAAVDPDLNGVAICLAGADLANLLLISSEGKVQNWRKWRQETDGISRDSLHWELVQSLTYEPSNFAPSVPTENVLFVSAALDTVVPRRHQTLLWEGLGRPERLDMPLGHYTAAILLDKVIGASAEHFRAHCPQPTP